MREEKWIKYKEIKMFGVNKNDLKTLWYQHKGIIESFYQITLVY